MPVAMVRNESRNARAGVAQRILRLVGAEPPEDAGLDVQLAALERQADGEVAGFEAFFYNRAGDLCLREGQVQRALGYYGRAIDAYLRAERFEAAGAVCQKLLRSSPAAVRARCTLAWVAIARGFTSQASVLVEEYVEAAFLAGKEEVASRHLARMAEVAADADLLCQIGEGLMALGASEAADRAFGRAIELGRGERTPASDEERHQAAIEAAVLGPREIQAREAA